MFLSSWDNLVDRKRYSTVPSFFWFTIQYNIFISILSLPLKLMGGMLYGQLCNPIKGCRS